MFTYLSQLTTSKLVLYCYLIWYLNSVYWYFDPTISIWLNSIGISAIIGIALLLSVGNARSWHHDKWQTFRLFLMPFCVSSFSSIIKGKGYFLVFPPDQKLLILSISSCFIFIAMVIILKKMK